MKLYRVRCRGMQQSHGIAFVVAPDATTAYKRVRDDLDERDLGMTQDREMESIDLVAEDAEYPGCIRRLYR